MGSTGLDEVVDHGAQVFSAELLELVGSTDIEDVLVLGHEPHSWLTLEVVVSADELGRPDCVEVVACVVEVVSMVVLLPKGWEDVEEEGTLLDWEVVEPPNGGVGWLYVVVVVVISPLGVVGLVASDVVVELPN